MLKRAPYFLRVVIDGAGGVDALDQLDDTPATHETIHAYEVVGEVGRCHILKRPRGSGWYVIANYKLCATQPSDEEMREQAKWVVWTDNEGRKRGLIK